MLVVGILRPHFQGLLEIGETDGFMWVLRHEPALSSKDFWNDDYRRTPLHEAARLGDLRAVEALIAANVDVDARDSHNETPLQIADGVGVAKLLLNAGADANVRDILGRGPLHWATERGEIEALRHLIEAGAHVNAKDAAGRTALYWANEQGNTGAAIELLKAGAKINEVGESKEDQDSR